LLHFVSPYRPEGHQKKLKSGTISHYACQVNFLGLSELEYGTFLSNTGYFRRKRQNDTTGSGLKGCRQVVG
jgi:hypothetical protein